MLMSGEPKITGTLKVPNIYPVKSSCIPLRTNSRGMKGAITVYAAQPKICKENKMMDSFENSDWSTASGLGRR